MQDSGCFAILPHTADIRLKARGDTLKDLFAQAMLGMAYILKKEACQNFRPAAPLVVERKISIKAPNETVLLIDFLSEILTASYEEKAVFCQARFEEISGKEVRAEIFGIKVDGFDEDIKAVTYHQAEVVRTKDGFEAVVLFDI